MARVRFPFPENDSFFSIRTSLKAICGGDDCAASLLDCLIYWDGVRRGAVQQEIARASGDKKYTPNLSLWIYKSSSHWSEDLCGHYGDSSIRSAVKAIISLGYAETRWNPDNPLDRTPQYRLNYDAVKGALRKWSADPGNFKLPCEPSDPGGEPENECEHALKKTDGQGENNVCSYTETTITETTETPPTPHPIFEKPTQEHSTGKITDGPAAIDFHTGEPIPNHFRRRKAPKEKHLGPIERYAHLAAAPANSHATSETPGGLQHPPAPPNGCSASGRDFSARWNELVPNAKVDPVLLPKNPQPYNDPVFTSRFDEICAKARALIHDGADLKFGFLLRKEANFDRYRWQALLAGELDWMRTKKEKPSDQWDDDDDPPKAKPSAPKKPLKIDVIDMLKKPEPLP
jgi:hypothetical protein